MGSSAPLLALLQGDREELCLGALVVLQVCELGYTRKGSTTCFGFWCVVVDMAQAASLYWCVACVSLLVVAGVMGER